MQLIDLVLVDRGPRLFDVWQNRERVPSPVGDFKVEFQVKIDQHPTPAMFAAAERLLAKFASDKEILVQRVFDNYLSVCANPNWADWLSECRVPVGLSLPELSVFLRSRTLTVDSELNVSVYISPDWDREHGLYFDLVDGDWQSNE